MFKRDVTLAQEYLGFMLLNLFDLFLTGFIFKNYGQEANGVALFVLHHFGLRGFALFKFIMVAFIILICEVISLQNVSRARQLILGASVLYLAVVMYEIYLVFMFIYKPLPMPKPVAMEMLRHFAGATGSLFIK
ncbi:MAG: DUF5658 family protein [Capsulimonadaceae bacterium]|nr:DUF5658 family protein [Capsulimonadaceae bacterium]